MSAVYSRNKIGPRTDPQVDLDILSPSLLHYGDDAPYIPVNLDGKLLPFLLDTGAAVSVLPKGKLLPLLPKPLFSYTCPETRDSRTITAFGGHVVTVEGLYVFPIEILTHQQIACQQLNHPWLCRKPRGVDEVVAE